MSNYQIAARAMKLPPQPLRFLPRLGAVTVRAASAAAMAEQKAAAQASFAEHMELTMTTLILAAVCLFGGGLLRYGAPACAARQFGVLVLDGGAGVLLMAAILLLARGLGRVANSLG